jgi:tartrate dehydratase alpha subunit/fumarate hydratase class I-like protein
MSSFDYKIVEEAAKELYIRALCDLPPDAREALKHAYERETNPTAKEIFKAMFKAIEISDQKKTLICQDTGLPIYMVKIGTGFHWDGAELRPGCTRAPSGQRRSFPSARAPLIR